MNAIDTHHLGKFYQRGRIRALDDLTLSVAPGRIFSLLGPNGAGKTTLIKLLLGIVHPSGGSARILGHPIGDSRAHGRIGYLAENHRFPDFLTARQVLYYFGRMSGLPSATVRDRIPALLDQVRLGEWMDTRIRKYSKGMLQRMGIAQALINDPDLLFLDEPTDGIDPVGRREIRDILVDLRARGKTIFLNSHLLSEVERVSDDVAILNHGRLVRQGSVEELIAVQRQYRLRVEGDPDAAAAVCRRMGAEVRAEGEELAVAVSDTDHLNGLIDALRGEGIQLLALVPHKVSLEDVFIEVVAERAEATP